PTAPTSTGGCGGSGSSRRATWRDDTERPGGRRRGPRFRARRPGTAPAPPASGPNQRSPMSTLALLLVLVQDTTIVIHPDSSGAEVTGGLIVVGGAAVGVAEARIGGEVRQYREPLLYRVRSEGDEIAYAPNLRRRLWNPGARVSWGTADSRSSLTIATGGTFNRVEGLPLVFGPLFDWKLRDNARFRLDALGVFRSAGDLSDSRSDLGYMLRAELQSGDARPSRLGFRAYD